jgi:hypothetical protein
MNLSSSAEMSDINVMLPFSMDALVAAESQADVMVDQLGIGHDQSLLFTLRSIINEGFRNALAVEPQPGRLQVIRLRMSYRKDGICIEILDPGRGFCINGCYPPYPESLLGSEWPLFTIVGEILSAKISNRCKVEFSVKQGAGADRTRTALLEETNSNGMGLAALCRQATRVAMNYDPNRGNQLEVRCLIAGNP